MTSATRAGSATSEASAISAAAISADSERPAAGYATLAGLVRPGEWTTYGDIAVAAHGSARFARHVARAATAGLLPNAERVLAAGGRIAPGWRDSDGGGPAACRDRLLDEGLTFIAGRADPDRAVRWEELLLRADLAGVDRAPVIGG